MFKPAVGRSLVHPYRDINRVYFGRDRFLEGNWSFNRGLAYDTSEKGRNGTIGGSIVEGPGAFGTGILIPPGGQTNSYYVNLGFSNFSGRSYTSEFTILAWARPMGYVPAGDSAVVVSHSGFYADSSTDFPVHVSWGGTTINPGGNYYCQISKGDDFSADATATIQSKASLTSPKWSLVVATYKATEHLALFVNGEYYRQSINFTIVDNAKNFYVGRAPTNNTGYSTFQGGISDVAIFSRALVEAEIRDYYNWALDLKKGRSTYFSLPNPPVDTKLSESLSISDVVDSHFSTSTVKISESLSIVDSTLSERVYSTAIAESLGITDVLDGEFVVITQVAESLGTISDVLGSSVVRTGTSPETLSIGDTLATSDSIFNRAVQESLDLNDVLRSTASLSRSLQEVVTIQDAVVAYKRLFYSVNIFNEIEPSRIFAYFPLSSFNITAPIFMKKNSYGTALRVSHSIASTVNMSWEAINQLLSETRVFSYSRITNNLMSDITVTSIRPEYQVLLDGEDVTGIVKSISITYSRDSYVGEVNINWANADMVHTDSAALYSRIDCSNIARNYMLERVEVYSRLLSNVDTSWVLQGKFFLEKRGTTVTFDGIEFTSWGRSRPAVLSMPYTKPLTFIWTENTTAKAITEDLCAYDLSVTPKVALALPVPLSWEIMDYRVLGSNVDVEGTEPIEVISTLAATVGGILTCKKDGTLRVVYKYPIS
jgi:hypothetical protein